MRITTILTYKGTESYTNKKNEQVTLHLFQNEHGEVVKQKLNGFVGEIDQPYACVFRKGRSKKDGAWQDYCYIISATSPYQDNQE